jgi:hypothetical protein
MTPFFANKGYHPVINVDIAKVEGAKALEIAQDWTTLNDCCNYILHILLSLRSVDYYLLCTYLVS